MNSISTALLVLSSALVPAQLPAGDEAAALERGLAAIQPDMLRADLEYIASDEMRGRDTPSNEQRLAARFLMNRVRRLGFQPGGRYGYLSEYPLSWKQADVGACSLTVGEATLVLGRDYLPSQFQELADLECEGGLVSIGDASSSSIKDAGLAGKWAVVQSASGSKRKLMDRVQAGGGVGLIALPEAGEDVLSANARNWSWMEEGRLTKIGEVQMPSIVLTQAGALRFLSACGLSALPEAGAELRGTAREVRRLSHPGGYRHFENVAAFWPGSDPELAKEVLIVSAHYDHVGVNSGVVFNGADDNGSGTTGLLALADALVAHGPMSRSVLLLWVSGEEKGLFGSAGWTSRPWLPAGHRPVADINIDMIGRNNPSELMITPTKDGRVANEYNALVRMAEAAGPLEGFTA